MRCGFKPDSPDLAAACYGRKPLPAGYPASRGPQDNCVVDKLMQFEAELKNPETSQCQRLAALQFVLNLVGDLSDPLNAIDRGDQGGHCIAVQIGSKPPVRLSTYWEETLVREVVGRQRRRRARPRSPRRSPPMRELERGQSGELGARQLSRSPRASIYALPPSRRRKARNSRPRRARAEPCPR